MTFTKKRVAVAAFLVVAGVALVFFAERSANNDPTRIAIVELLRHNEGVVAKAGIVANATLVRRVSVGPNGPGGHRVYTFVVSGTKANVTVVVRAENLGGELTAQQYTIESIDP